MRVVNGIPLSNDKPLYHIITILSAISRIYAARQSSLPLCDNSICQRPRMCVPGVNPAPCVHSVVWIPHRRLLRVLRRWHAKRHYLSRLLHHALPRWWGHGSVLLTPLDALQLWRHSGSCVMTCSNLHSMPRAHTQHNIQSAIFLAYRTPPGKHITLKQRDTRSRLIAVIHHHWLTVRTPSELTRTCTPRRAGRFLRNTLLQGSGSTCASAGVAVDRSL